MRKLIGAIVATGVVVTTVAFVKAARNGVKKMSGTQGRGSERQTAPDYQAITVGCTGSESNLRVKAWVKQS